jgi:hypothetical protein
MVPPIKEEKVKRKKSEISIFAFVFLFLLLPLLTRFSVFGKTPEQPVVSRQKKMHGEDYTSCS